MRRPTQELLRIGLWLAIAGCGDDAADAVGGGRPDAASGPADAASERDAAHAEQIPPEILAHARDWPLPNFDYDNTRATFAAAIDSTSIGGLREAWRLSFERSAPYGFVTANPIVAGDRVYIQDMVSRVYVLDRESGELAWRSEEFGATVGPNGVALGWGKVFAGLADTGIIAFDAADGSEQWRFEPALVQSEGIDIQPVAFGGMLFVSTVPASLRGVYLAGSRGLLYALDQRDGSVRWSFDTVDSSDLWGDPERNSGGGAWYPPLIDPERGLSYWGTGNPGPWPSPIDSPNGIDRPGPNLYTDSVVALDLESGGLAWYHQEHPHDLFDWDFQNAPMRVRPSTDSGGKDLVIGSGKTGTVVALDAESGSLIWRAKVGRHENDDLDALPEGVPLTIYPGALGGVLTATAYADGVVYVPIVDMSTTYTGPSQLALEGTTSTGALAALSVIDGSLLWSVELPDPCYGAATVVNDLVLTSTAEGLVVALARDDGEEVWRYQAPGGINAPLAVAGDLLLVPVGVAEAGLLIALRL